MRDSRSANSFFLSMAARWGKAGTTLGGCRSGSRGIRCLPYRSGDSRPGHVELETSRDNFTNLYSLIKKADDSLFEAKAAGRNRIKAAKLEEISGDAAFYLFIAVSILLIDRFEGYPPTPVELLNARCRVRVPTHPVNTPRLEIKHLSHLD